MCGVEAWSNMDMIAKLLEQISYVIKLLKKLTASLTLTIRGACLDFHASMTLTLRVPALGPRP